jgi:hypothetical protein
MDKHFPSLRDYGDPTSDFLIEDTTEADEANPNQAWRPYVEYIDVDGGSPEANVLLPTSHHGGHDPYRLPSLPPDDQSMVVDSEELLPSRSPADNAQPDRLEELLLRSSKQSPFPPSPCDAKWVHDLRLLTSTLPSWSPGHGYWSQYCSSGWSRRRPQFKCRCCKSGHSLRSEIGLWVAAN